MACAADDPRLWRRRSGSGRADDPPPAAPVQSRSPAPPRKSAQPAYQPSFNLDDLHEALDLVRQMDPPGVACRDLRDCLLYQLRYHQHQLATHKNGNGEATAQVLADAVAIVDQHLRALQNKQYKEIARAINRPPEAVQEALEYIRTLDPRPGLRYNKSQPRLIEPDVAFIKHGDEWLVMMNEDDVPVLRLNPAYKRLLTRDTNDKDTRNYVKERYKSAIQLIKNIEQRKQTITKVCYSIVTRQQDFLEKGIDQLKPMMIKEVAEEIGVHPSTVSRAVANKYAHTPQGVFELRYFFSESVNGPQGGNTSLLILKRRVKKLIEEEDPTRPLTDEQITRILAVAGYPGHSPHGREVPGRHAHPQHPSAQSEEITVAPASRRLYGRHLAVRAASATKCPMQCPWQKKGALMNVEFTGRKCEITPALRKSVETGLAKIRKILGDKFDSKVILAVEKHRHKAEITISPRNGPLVGDRSGRRHEVRHQPGHRSSGKAGSQIQNPLAQQETPRAEKPAKEMERQGRAGQPAGRRLDSKKPPRSRWSFTSFPPSPSPPRFIWCAPRTRSPPAP